MNKLSPDGWEKSDLFFIHHPTAQQPLEEVLNFHNNIKNFFRKNDKKLVGDPPKRKDFFSESLAKQLEKEKRKKEAAKLREDLDQIYEESVEEAKYKPLPEIVLAYQNIYGHLPRGWPHRGI